MSELTKGKIAEFTIEILDFIYLYCSDYCIGDATFEIDNYDADNFNATVKMQTYSDKSWEIPIGINTEGELGIVACADVDSYLELNGEGLYVYLFSEANKELLSVEEKHEKFMKRFDALADESDQRRKKLEDADSEISRLRGIIEGLNCDCMGSRLEQPIEDCCQICRAKNELNRMEGDENRRGGHF